MHARTVLAIAVSCLTGPGLMSSAWAASTPGKTIQEQKTLGQYRLVLKIGPAESMSDMGGMGGEMAVGGKPATCRVSGMKGGSMHGQMCNHHVELHVYTARTGKVVITAQVGIVLRDAQKHLSMTVPIMKMMAGSNLKDFHYGNNIYAGPGNYTIQVTVNGLHTTFTARLT